MLIGANAKFLVRSFAVATSNVIPAVKSLADKFTLQALESYKKSKTDVDKELDKVC
jgi:hypothetical protein